MTDAELQQKMEETVEELEEAFSQLADHYDIDVEVEGGVLSVTFEEGEPGKFIISPNSSARQLWVSARVSSYKFDWSQSQSTFVLASTGETIKDVIARLTREQLGNATVSL